MKYKTITLTVLLIFIFFSLNGEVVLNDFEKITAYHKLSGFIWKSPVVPRITVNKMPEEIKELTGLKKTRFFIKVLLPLILVENEKIEKERDMIMAVAQKDEWGTSDIKIIRDTAYKYRIIEKNKDVSSITTEEKDEILYFLDHRIRPVPVPIALGQAALESGWGTSRFVFEGNNLFGHVAKNHKDGLKPKNWSGNERHIKIFPGLKESISAYMLNLNRNKAYKKFRWLRREYPGNAFKIAEGFGKYAIIKEEYIGRLQLVMTKYGLYRLNDSTLDNDKKMESIKKIKQIYIN